MGNEPAETSGHTHPYSAVVEGDGSSGGEAASSRACLVLIDRQDVGLSLTRPEILWAILDHMQANLPDDDVCVFGTDYGFGVNQQRWLTGLGAHWRTPAPSGPADVETFARGRVDVGLATGDVAFQSLLQYLKRENSACTLLHTRPRVDPLLASEADTVICLASFRPGASTTDGPVESIHPRGTWDHVALPWASLLGPAGGLGPVLRSIAQRIDTSGLTNRQMRGVFNAHGMVADLLVAAMHTDDLISPDGPLLQTDAGSDQLKRLNLAAQSEWVEEAHLVCLGAALAAVVARSRDTVFRTAAFLQAGSHTQDPGRVATAWGRVQHQYCPPMFVIAAARDGVQVPSDAWVRYGVLHHLHAQNLQTGKGLKMPTLSQALDGAPTPLNRAEKGTLLRALIAAGAQLPTTASGWTTAIDGQWIGRVVNKVGRLNGGTPVNKQRLNSYYFYDIPPGVDVQAVIDIATR